MAGVVGLEPTPAIMDIARQVLLTTIVFTTYWIFIVCGLEYIFTLLSANLGVRLSTLYGLKYVFYSLGIAS